MLPRLADVLVCLLARSVLDARCVSEDLKVEEGFRLLCSVAARVAYTL